MDGEVVEARAQTELPPGYYLDQASGAWLTLPWPANHEDLPPSLGPAVIRWCHTWLVHHLSGEPWRFTPGQARFLHQWYAVRPDGRWLYRSGVKRGAKGTGKDPMAAAIALAELAGPTYCAGMRDGRPIAVPHRMALVQIAANSEAQAKDVLRVANGMAGLAFREAYGYDAGELRSLLPTRSRIELLTNSEASSEGDPATAILLNESHHMTRSNGGHALARVGRRNVAKSPGGRARLLELTNAHVPAEGSVAEGSFDAWQAQVSGKARTSGILYDSREAPAHLRLHVDAERQAGIAAAYSDSPWTDQERIDEEALDLRTPVQDSVRFYFNALPTNETAWCDPRAWDDCARPGEVIADGEQVAMFLDCSKSEDATALVAVRMSDGHVITLGIWSRPHGDRGKTWLAPRAEVDTEVMAADARWDVVWFGVDPSPAKDDDAEALYWQPMVDKWHSHFRAKVLLWATPGAGGNAVLWDMRTWMSGGKDRNRIFVEAAERTVTDIEGDEDQGPTLTHDGDARMRQHVHAARRRPTGWGTTLGKRTRDSKQLVDAAVTMVGARMGRRLVLLSGKVRDKKPRTGRAVF